MKDVLTRLLLLPVVYLVGYVGSLTLGIPLKAMFGILFLMFVGYLLVDWLANEQEKVDAQTIEEVEIYEIIDTDD